MLKWEMNSMKICLKCKQPCNDDNLEKCPKCKGELIPYSQEKYNYYMQSQKQQNNRYTSKEDRMYQDIHTIKNILMFFVVLVAVTLVINLIMAIG